MDNVEGKCLYCGRKMETILEELQGQIENLELSEEMETIMYIDLAALKQVRIVRLTSISQLLAVVIMDFTINPS